MAKKKPKQLLFLDQREAKLGAAINTWALNLGAGGETAPAKGIPLTTSISRGELCSWLREPLAAESFFKTNAAGLAIPLWSGKVAPEIHFEGDFPDSALTIYAGINLIDIVLKPVTIKSVVAVPLDGGRLTVKFMAHYRPEENDDLRELERWLKHDVKIELTLGAIEDIDNKQPELPMNDSSDTPKTLADAIAQDDRDTAALGSPDEERDRAKKRERDIALQIENDRNAGGVVGNTLASPSKRVKRGKGADRAAAH